ncbi:MAG: hypothetical protein JNK72_19220 [Myxococcales bacterium]|nr:hypothetical protein [Myxococcales bacterium]
MRRVSLLGLALCFASVACTNYRDQLERADGHYRQARYEAALSNLEDLEGDLGHFDRDERIRYEYVRGMTHARLNQRADARHWLAIVRERTDGDSRALSEEARSLLERTLTEVDTTPAAPTPAGAQSNSAPAAAATPATPRR